MNLFGVKTAVWGAIARALAFLATSLLEYISCKLDQQKLSNKFVGERRQLGADNHGHLWHCEMRQLQINDKLQLHDS